MIIVIVDRCCDRSMQNEKKSVTEMLIDVEQDRHKECKQQHEHMHNVEEEDVGVVIERDREKGQGGGTT